MIFCPEWLWPASVTFNVILYIFRIPEFVQEALYCEAGWSISAWKFPPKLYLSMDNWFHHKIILYNHYPTENLSAWSFEAGKQNFGNLTTIFWKTEAWVNLMWNGSNNQMGTSFCTTQYSVSYILRRIDWHYFCPYSENTFAQNLAWSYLIINSYAKSILQNFILFHSRASISNCALTWIIIFLNGMSVLLLTVIFRSVE